MNKEEKMQWKRFLSQNVDIINQFWETLETLNISDKYNSDIIDKEWNKKEIEISFGWVVFLKD